MKKQTRLTATRRRALLSVVVSIIVLVGLSIYQISPVLADAGDYINQWGSYGLNTGRFNYPYGMALDSAGNVYVADTYNDRIQVFDGAGGFLRTWGSTGSGDGQFNLPQGVAVDNLNNIYVADTNNHRIQVFDSAGTFLRAWGWGVADGSAAFQVCTLGCQSGISGSSNGQFSSPRSVAVDGAGNVYVSDTGNDRIQVFDSAGTFQRTWGSTGTSEGQFDTPSGVALDSAGNVYVADTNNRRIQVFDNSGTFLRTWGFGVRTGINWFEICTSSCRAGFGGGGAGQFRSPQGVGVDSLNNVYVADTDNYRIQVFASSGTFLRTWGWGVADGTAELQVCTSGCQRGILGSGDGQFNQPADVVPDNTSNVYIVDTYNHRIQIFEGEPLPYLTMTKAVLPEGVANHGAMTYTVVLRNRGTLSDTQVLFTDTLPTEVDFGAWVISPTGTLLNSDELTWSGTVTASDALTWTFSAQHVGNLGDIITNTAEFSGTMQAGTATAVSVVRPVLGLSKVVTPTTDVTYHGPVTYTVVLSNSGAIDDSAVLFTDTLPTEVDFGAWVISPPGTLVNNDELTWSGPLTAGEALTWTFTTAHIGAAADIVTNTAAFSGTFQTAGADATFTVEDITADFIITVKTDNAGTSSNTQFRIPTFSSETYNYNVDCDSDGINDITGAIGPVTCSYPVIGTYTIRIKDNVGDGTGFPRIYFNNGGDRQKLLTIEQWGKGKWTSMGGAFYGCANLTGDGDDAPDLSSVLDLSGMFNGATYFNGAVDNWDTSSVTNMSYMFNGASLFNQPIGNWDTSQVTNMSGMFNGASLFNQDIITWTTASVTNMSYMFSGASRFNQPLGGWDTAKVTNMRAMFDGASRFNQPLGGWDTTQVTTMREMFRGASRFNQDIGGWTTTNVLDMSRMFQNASTFNQPLGGWDTAKVTDMSYMFSGASAFNQNIGGWTTSSVLNTSYMFQNAVAFNQPLGGWDTAKVTDMSYMFNGASLFNQNIITWTTASVLNMSYMFQKAIAFNQPLGGWDTAQVTDMRYMFNGASLFNQNIITWTTTSVLNMSYMFQNASAFDQPLGDWDTAQVTDMSYMFSGASLFNQNIITWTTTSVLNMSYMFQNAVAFNQPLDGWDTAKVTNMSYMFQNASAFNQPLDGWDTAKVRDMRYMFNGASLFNQNIITWRTTNVLDMSNMFNGASLFNQDIGGWTTSKVTNMANMFNGADDFNQDIGGWNVAALTNATAMFANTQLSTANYDALLIGWDAQTLRSGVTFGGGNSTYCAGASARTHMTTPTASGGDGWTITDGGLACGIVWDGEGSDSNWSTALNWVGDTVPGAGDRVTFNGTSSKDAVMDATFGGAVAGVILAPEYGGTISFARSLAVGGDYSQYGGTVVIDPAHAFTVEGSFIHAGGALQETRDVGASSAVNFLQIRDSGNTVDKYRGVDLDTTTGGNDLGSTTVAIKAVDLTSEFCTTDGVTSPPYANRCFTITPTNKLSANVTLWALTSQLPGGITTPSVYHYSGGSWVELSNIATGTAGAYTWASGDTTGFSPFLIAQSGAGTNAPTALTLQRFAAHPVTGFLAGGVLLGLVVLALGPGLALGLIPLRHHHSQKGDSR